LVCYLEVLGFFPSYKISFSYEFIKPKTEEWKEERKEGREGGKEGRRKISLNSI
jgi:hypothetical protein